MKNEIILYRPGELVEHIEVRIDEATVWLNRQQIATLFGRDVKTIGKHINNVFSEGELIKEVVVAKFATTTPHGVIKERTQAIKALGKKWFAFSKMEATSLQLIMDSIMKLI